MVVRQGLFRPPTERIRYTLAPNMGLCGSKSTPSGESATDPNASPVKNQYGEGRDDNDDLEAVMYLRKKHVSSGDDEEDTSKKSTPKK